MRTFEAGFDAVMIPGADWKAIMDEHQIADAVLDGRTWRWQGPDGFVVTRFNPITGRQAGDDRRVEPDYASSIGIEGNAEFVASVYVAINDMATDSKSEVFGSRAYI
jgi:hypothetical protein